MRIYQPDHKEGVLRVIYIWLKVVPGTQLCGMVVSDWGTIGQTPCSASESKVQAAALAILVPLVKSTVVSEVQNCSLI